MLDQDPIDPPKNEKLKKLHEELVKQKFSVPEDFSTFEEAMANPEKAKVFHGELVKQKFAVPEDYDQFSTALGLKKKDESQQAIPGETDSGTSSEVLPPTGTGTSPELEKLTAKDRHKKNLEGLGSLYQDKFEKELQPHVDAMQAEYDGHVYKKVLEATQALGEYQKFLTKDHDAMMTTKVKEVQAEVDKGKIKPSDADKQIKEYEKSLNDGYNKSLKAKNDEFNAGITAEEKGKAAEFKTKFDEFRKGFEADFNKKNAPEMEKWAAEFDRRFQEQDFQENKVKNPITSFGKSIWNSFRYQLPADMIAGQMAMEKFPTQATNATVDKLPQSIQNFLKGKEIPKQDGKDVSTGIEWVDRMLTSMTHKPSAEEALAMQKRKLEPSPEEKRRQANLAMIFNLKNDGSEASKYLVGGLSQVEDFTDAINWAGVVAGGMIPTVAGAMATKGASFYGQEIGGVYMEGLQKLAKEKKMTPEEIIKKGLDDSLYPVIYGAAAAKFMSLGTGRVGKEFMGAFSKAEVLGSLRERAMATIKSGATSAIEGGLTMGAANLMSQVGSSKAAGETWEQTFKNIDPNALAESIAGGAVGIAAMRGMGLGLRHSFSHLIRRRMGDLKFTDFKDVTAEEAKKEADQAATPKVELPPAPEIKGEPVPEQKTETPPPAGEAKGVETADGKRRVFVYGTLLDPEIRKAALGGEEVDTAPGVATRVLHEDGEYSTLHPGSGKMEGEVMELTPEQVQRLDNWEEKYTRKEITLADGSKAEAFIRKPEFNSEGKKTPKQQENVVPEPSTTPENVGAPSGNSPKMGEGNTEGATTGTQKGPSETPAPQDQKPPSKVEGESTILKVKDFPVKDLSVDVKRFQNRNEDFSESSVNSIVKSIEDASFDASAFLDPVRIWKDPKDNKTYVLSGHSRTEAFRKAQQLLDEGKLSPEAVKNLNDQGIKDFNNMPVVDVSGKTEEQAINIGLSGNTKATQETELEGAKAARKMREGGESMATIKEKLGNRANKARLINFSFLNPNGKAYQALQSVEKSEKSENKSTVVQVGEFLGEARAKYPQLTDSHENELFDYLTTGSGKNHTKRAEFLEEIDRRVGDAFFNPEDPLNMNNRPSIGYNESLIRAQINEVNKRLKELERDRAKESQPGKSAEMGREIDNLRKELVRLNEEQRKAREGDRQQGDLFGGGGEEKKPEAVEKKPKETKKEEPAEGHDEFLSKLNPGDRVTFTDKSGKKHDVNYRGIIGRLGGKMGSLSAGEIDGWRDSEPLIVGKSGSGIDQMRVTWEQLSPPEKQKPIVEVKGKAKRDLSKPTDDIDKAFKGLEDLLGGDVSNMGAIPRKTMDPKVQLAGAEIVNKYIDSGKSLFPEIAKDVYDRYGEDRFRKFFDAIKAGYSAMLSLQDDTTGLSTAEDLKSFKADGMVELFESLNSQDDDGSTATGLEPNSGSDKTKQPVGTENVQPSGASGGQGAGKGTLPAGTPGVQQQGDLGFSDRIPPPIEQPADTKVDVGPSNPPINERVGRGTDDSGRTGTSEGGVPSGGKGADKPTKTSDDHGTKRLTLKEKAKLQESADRNVKVVAGDMESIKASLPILIPHQHDNVFKAEKRLLNPPAEGQVNKGIMFTDGTGTGKTFTGLGVIKRFDRMGKKRVLIVVPTDKVAKNWMEDAAFFGMEVKQLSGITDAGDGYEKVVTSYANFRQNDALLGRSKKSPFDLVVYDEAHRLVSNQDGSGTAADERHKEITISPNNAKKQAEQSHESQIQRDRATNGFGGISKTTKESIAKETKRLTELTKVMFLSASPFAYRKNLSYADGYLFTIKEGQAEPSAAYNEFYVKNFGYQVKYHRLQEPEVGIDVGLMERMFHTQLVKSGAVSSTRLAFDKDYSREFILMDDKLGLDIDEGFRYASERMDAKGRERRHLPDIIRRRFNWLYQNQLLEAIKAKHSIDRIQKHLDLGRKVIVFHGYNDNLPKHPFDLNDPEIWGLDKMDPAEAMRERLLIEREIADFHAQYPKYKDLDLSGLTNPIKTIKDHFAERAVFFNGMVGQAQRGKNMGIFNKDGSGVDIIVLQMEAGKEGVSLHDVTGVHQRAMINLGLPYKPTDAIQTEGRPYRYGLMTDVPIEYPVLHLNFEKRAFGDKINARVSTAENLAFGEAGRNLGKSFKEGYNNPITDEPYAEQGTGGKERDSAFDAMDEFEKAKTYYIARGKRNAKTKSREGVDYYATPEPLGYKMVEWLDTKINGKLLEPSAGHGAIARFFPDYTANKFIEPSYELRADLSINTNGDVMATTFEEHDIINKYDGIAMNPPYGSSGKTAMDHVLKGLGHLRNSGRLIAIVPDGPAMQKRIDQFWESGDSKGFYQIATIKLPSVTFERAGTSVRTQIIVIDKQIEESIAETLPQHKYVEFSNAETINEFFDRIKDFTISPRVIAIPKKTVGEILGTRGGILPNTGITNPDVAPGKIAEVIQAKHTKLGFDITVVKMNVRLSDEDYRKANAKAKELGGYYSSYKGGGAIPGFTFKGPDQAEKSNQLFDYLTNRNPEGPTPEQSAADELSSAMASKGAPAKGKIKMHEFEHRQVAPKNLINGDTGKPFQLYQAVVDLVHKYNPDSSLTTGGKYVSRGSEGTFYRASESIAIRGLNSLSVAMHELTHALDKRYGVITSFIDATQTSDPLRKRLTDLYVQYYPNAKASHALRLRMIEGYATLVQKYLESPTEIKKQYPDLVAAFLTPKGANGVGFYYFDSLGEFMQDAGTIIEAYQAMAPLGKIGSRIVYDNIDTSVDNPPWMERPDDWALYEAANNLHPVESMMKYLGLSMTGEDVSLHMRRANNFLAIVNHNVNSVNYGLKWKGGPEISRKETFLAMNSKGEFVPRHPFNFHTIARSISNRGLSRDWSAWLYARDVRGDYEYVHELEDEIAEVQDPSFVQTLVGQGMTQDVAESLQKMKIAELEAEMARVGAIIENESIDEDTAQSAYDEGVELFKKEADMFDKLMDEDLYLANHPKVMLLDNEGLKRIKKKKGYSPRKRVIYSDLNVNPSGIPSIKGGGRTKISSLMTRRGGEQPIMDPFVAATMNHAEFMRKAMKQMVYNELYRVVEANQKAVAPAFLIQVLKTSPDKMNRYPQEKDPDIIMARKDYQRAPLLTGGVMKQVFEENFSFDNHHLIEKAFIVGSQTFRSGTTGLFLPFAVTNFLFLDQIVAFTNSRNGMIPYGSTFKQLTMAAVDPLGPERKYMQEYMALTGTAHTALGADFAANRRSSDVIKGQRSTWDKVLSVASVPAKVMSVPGNLSEMATRMTEYIMARKAGKPQIVAMEEAGRVSAPFHHVGRLGGKPGGISVGRTAVRSIPYLNSSIEVLTQTGESLKTPEGRIKFGITIASMMAAAVAGTLAILAKDDDDKQKQALISLSPEEQTKYLYFPSPYSSRLLRFRVGEQFGSLTGMANMMLIESAGLTDYKWYEYAHAGTNFLPTQVNPFAGYQSMFFGMTPQLVKPSIESLMGKKTYPEVRNIENAKDAHLPPQLRYNKYTSPVAIKMGSELGWSPKKIDHFLEGTLGRTARFFTGKIGAEQMFGFKDIFSRELYFDASRQIQFYYDVKEENAQKLYALLEGKIDFTQEETDQIQEIDGLIGDIEGALGEFHEYEEAGEEDDAAKVRSQIFEMVRVLESKWK